MSKLLCFLIYIFSTIVLIGQTSDTNSLFDRLSNFSQNVSEEEINSQLKDIHRIPEDKLAKFYIDLANYQQVIFRDNKQANANYHRALEQSKISEYNKADALNGIATIYNYYNHNDLAIKNYKKALSIIEQHYPDSIVDINSILSNIGFTFSTENHIDSAIYYYQKAIDFGKANGKPSMGAYFNLGNIVQNQDSAYSYTLKALEEVRLPKQAYVLTFCYLNLGSIEVTRGNLEEAERFLSLSRKNAIKFKQSSYTKEIDIQEARLFIAKNKIYEGIQQLLSAENYFKTENNYKQLEAIYYNLEKAYAKIEDFENAYVFLKKYHKNINDRNYSKNIRFEEGNQLYNDQKLRNQIQIEKSERDRQFYIIVLCVLFGIIGMVLIVFYKYKRKQKIKNSIISHKNQSLNEKVNTLKNEQVLNQQQLLFKNLLMDENQNFLKSILDDLKDLSKNNTSNSRKKITDLYQKIQVNIKDNVGEEFEYYFKEVHPSFYKSFSERGFSLSKNEMRLAALIKLNFDTKEISNLTKQSSNTINVAKSRLKTKLNLDKNDSLYQFIQSV